MGNCTGNTVECGQGNRGMEVMKKNIDSELRVLSQDIDIDSNDRKGMESREEIERRLQGRAWVEIDDGMYRGEMDNSSLRNGFGQYRWKDGAEYTGQWRDDKMEGYGRIIHSDKDIYEGYWTNNRAEGKGVFLRKDGTIFQGEWIGDKQQGEGKERWRSGLRYSGQYADGRKEGKGVLTLPDGNRYEVGLSEGRVSSR